MPLFLRTHYQQYKRDTAQLSTWLVKTASSLGYPLASLDVSTDVQTEGEEGRTAAQVRNAKKNARKKAKAKAQKPGEDGGQAGNGIDESDGGKAEQPDSGPSDTPSPTSPGTGNYSLKVGQYTELAKYVLDKGLDVPVEVLRILRRCISLRQRAMARFANDESPVNDGHRHFVNALQQVLSLFSAQANTTSGTESDATSTTNRFANLAIDEEEDPEDLADIQLPGISSNDTVRATVAITADEAIFAIITFLEDVESIRLYIDCLWRDYKAGSVDLITAAVTTNTALELLRGPHDDLMKRVMPLFQGNMDKMITFVVLAMKGTTLTNIARDLPKFPDVRKDDFTTASVYDFTMFPIIQILGGLAVLLDDRNVTPAYKAGYYGYSNPAETVQKEDFKKRWSQYQILMTESFTDLFYLLEVGNMDRNRPGPFSGPRKSSPNNFFFLDELVKSSHDFFESRKWDFMLAAACQIFLDINLILGSKTSDGSRKLRSTAARMDKMFDSRRAIEGPVQPATWDMANEHIIKRMQLEIHHWREFDFRSLATKIPGLDGSGAKFMERNPTLCGLILFRIHIFYQDIGFKLSNTWGTILGCAHLNNACRFTFFPGEARVPAWKDMDLVIDMHGIDDVFDGPAPANLDEAQSSFLRMGGYPKSAIDAFERFGLEGQDVPAHMLDVTRSGRSLSPKTLTDRTQILPIFKRKFIADHATGLEYDIKTIEKLLSDVQNQQLKADKTDTESVGQSSSASTKGKGKAGRSGPKRRKLRRERKHRSLKFSVVQLLAVLEEGLSSETRSIRFDYVSMHLRCLRLLKFVHGVSRASMASSVGHVSPIRPKWLFWSRSSYISLP